MSVYTWGHKMSEIEESSIKNIAPEEWDNLSNVLDKTGIDLEEWVKACQYDDVQYAMDGHECSEDEFQDLFQMVSDAYSSLCTKVKDETAMEIVAFVPTSNIERGECRIYWNVENTMIPNPEIDSKFISMLNDVEVIQYG